MTFFSEITTETVGAAESSFVSFISAEAALPASSVTVSLSVPGSETIVPEEKALPSSSRAALQVLETSSFQVATVRVPIFRLSVQSVTSRPAMTFTVLADTVIVGALVSFAGGVGGVGSTGSLPPHDAKNSTARTAVSRFPVGAGNDGRRNRFPVGAGNDGRRSRCPVKPGMTEPLRCPIRSGMTRVGLNQRISYQCLMDFPPCGTRLGDKEDGPLRRELSCCAYLRTAAALTCLDIPIEHNTAYFPFPALAPLSPGRSCAAVRTVNADKRYPRTAAPPHAPGRGTSGSLSKDNKKQSIIDMDLKEKSAEVYRRDQKRPKTLPPPCSMICTPKFGHYYYEVNEKE